MMKKIAFLLIVFSAVTASAQSQWTTSGTSIFYNGGNVGVGTSTPAARLDVREITTILGSSAGNNLLLSRVAGPTGNVFMHNLWLFRSAAGSDWGTARLHDAISVDGSFLTPGVDTKTWWERDPAANLQRWGSAGTAYMTLNGPYLGLGTGTPFGGLHVKGTGQTSANPTITSTSGAQNGSTLFLEDTGTNGGNGGMVAFGAGGGHFGAIKGVLGSLAGNSTGSLIFATRNAAADTSLTERMRIHPGGGVSIGTVNPNGALNLFRSTANETTFTSTFDATISQNTTTTSGRAAVISATHNVLAGISNTTPGGLTGAHIQALNTGAGTMGTTTGAAIFAGNSAGGINNIATGVYVQVGAGTGSLGTGYGLYLQDVGAATAYGVFQTGANDVNYFAGKIGIGGLPAPTFALDVTGSAHVSGNLTVDGNIAAKYQDFAEWVPAREDLAPGTVVVLDPAIENMVAKSGAAYDTTVAGVVSEQPGIILGTGDATKEQIATTGRVKVRVDARMAPIAIGDLLVTSDTPGMAMKSRPVDVSGIAMHRPGTIIGKALEPLADGQGEILVLLSLQ